jgi:hypothetical protein
MTSTSGQVTRQIDEVFGQRLPELGVAGDRGSTTHGTGNARPDSPARLVTWPLQTACPADSATGETSRRKAPENPDMCQPPNRMPSRQSRGMLQASGEDLRLLRLELLLGEHAGILQLAELLQLLEHVIG